MFGLDMTTLGFIGLATLAAGGLIYAVMFDRVSNEVRQAQRVKSIRNPRPAKNVKANARVADVAKRKRSVQDALKEIETKQKEKSRKSVGLRKQIQQAGLKLTIQQFILISIFCGFAFAVIALLAGAPTYLVPVAGLVGGFGFPRWMVGRIRASRMKKFVAEFPNAVDVIVRGVRAGLPVNDCLAIIAREAKEPVAGEFRRLIEAQQLGLPLSVAVLRLYDNMPLPESNFFGIVISIQQQAGGNLSEALGNLSNVLRDRKKMKQKIQAMSAEAKASAGIIGALPFAVSLMVYLTTPDYIKILFTDHIGNIILVCAGLWMTMGILVMKKMISFDF